jgi:hypothetical protein
MENISKLEEELAALDRDWERQRETFLVRNRDGTLGEPTGVHLIPRVLIMVGSVVLMAFLSATSVPAVIIYVLLIPFSLATFQLLSGAGKSDGFDRAKSVYESHRSAILRKLETVRKSASTE